jgi:hypothetical protein
LIGGVSIFAILVPPAVLALGRALLWERQAFGQNEQCPATGCGAVEATSGQARRILFALPLASDLDADLAGKIENAAAPRLARATSWKGLPADTCGLLSIAALALDPLKPPTGMVAGPSRDAVDRNRRAFLDRGRYGDLYRLA